MRLEVQTRRKRTTSCPYCRASIRRDEEAWSCPRCSTIHHAECARQNSGCTLLACGGRYSTVRPHLGLWAQGAAFALVSLVLLVGIVRLIVGSTALAPRPSQAAVDSSRPEPQPATPAPAHPVRATAPAIPERAPKREPFKAGDATTTWAGVARGSSFILETTAGLYVEREQIVLDEVAGESAHLSIAHADGKESLLVPVTTNHAEGWSHVTPLPDQVVEVPAGRFECRHFFGFKTIAGGKQALVDVWLAPGLPVPVKSRVTTQRGTTTTVYAGLALGRGRTTWRGFDRETTLTVETRTIDKRPGHRGQREALTHQLITFRGIDGSHAKLAIAAHERAAPLVVDAPLEEDHLGVAHVTLDEEEWVATLAGTFKCRHVQATFRTCTWEAEIEVWIDPRLPVPVKSIFRTRDLERVSTLVARNPTR